MADFLPEIAEPVESEAVLARIRQYRKAARQIVSAEWVEVPRRCLALLELVDAARAEPDAVTRRWSELAVWSESQAFLGLDDEKYVTMPEPYERAQRRLVSQGYSLCPECRSTLADQATLQRWSAMRSAYAERLEVRSKAADR